MVACVRRFVPIALLLLVVAPGSGAPADVGGTIVFQDGRSGAEALYAVQPDGSGLAKVADLPGDAAVFWSPDGKRAFVLAGRRSFELQVASGRRRAISLGPLVDLSGESVSWSADGTKLAYVAMKGLDTGDIVVRDVQSGRTRRLANVASDGALAWSPDGAKIAFVNWADVAVETISVTGGGSKRVAPLGSFDADAQLAWSADGKWISIAGSAVVSSGGGRFHTLGPGAADAVWAPTGARIAFADRHGIVVADQSRGGRHRLTRNPLDVVLAWSPDGQRIAFTRNDLGSQLSRTVQLWTLNADGSDQREVTHTFPDGGSVEDAVWTADSAKGTPEQQLPLVAFRDARTLGTALPIVALAAAGGRAAIGQGLDDRAMIGPRTSLAPVVVWDPSRASAKRFPVHCKAQRFTGFSLDAVVLSGTGAGYLCDFPSISYGGVETLWLQKPGARPLAIVRTEDGEFSGSFVSGVAGDGTSVAYGVGTLRETSRGDVYTAQTKIWTSTGSQHTLVRVLKGSARVVAVDGARTAVLAGRKAVVLGAGRARTFWFQRAPLNAVFDGPRLFVQEPASLVVVDLANGRRRTVRWSAERGFGPPPVLADARADLAVYVVGAGVHVLRITDGEEIVADAPNATTPVLARLTSRGLFYSYNEANTRRPGRLVFVPREALERALSGH
jgi:WD40-like Beta Propeller Repeat